MVVVMRFGLEIDVVVVVAVVDLAADRAADHPLGFILIEINQFGVIFSVGIVLQTETKRMEVEFSKPVACSKKERKRGVCG